jgi:hypothetical protein
MSVANVDVVFCLNDVGLMKFTIAEKIPLLFITGIGLFELFYRHNFTDGFLALGIALGLLIYDFFERAYVIKSEKGPKSFEVLLTVGNYSCRKRF